MTCREESCYEKVLCYCHRYLRESDWKTIAALKLCLMSLGVLVGIMLPARHKKTAAAVALPVFVVTYLPLVSKLFHVAAELKQEEENV